MEPLSLLLSPALSSQTWWTRFCLMKNLTRRSSENAQPQSVRWTGRTALLQRRRRKRTDPLWSTVLEVRLHSPFICSAFTFFFYKCENIHLFLQQDLTFELMSNHIPAVLHFLDVLVLGLGVDSRDVGPRPVSFSTVATSSVFTGLKSFSL